MYDKLSQHSRKDSRVTIVTGMGKVSAQPNVSIIQLGVENQGDELTDTQQENAAIINQITQSLLQIGVPKESIRTVDYYIYPEYDYVDGKQMFRGYQVTHMLSVTMNDISASGHIIDTAVQMGANRVADIQFTVENQQYYEQQALKEALRRALAKAHTIAETLNLNIDPTPIRIDEKPVGPTSDVQPLTQSKVLSSGSTTIEPGQLEVIARVVAEFQYYS